MNSLFYRRSIIPSDLLKSLQKGSDFILYHRDAKFITDFLVAICICKIKAGHIIFSKCVLPTKEFLQKNLNRDQLDLLSGYFKNMSVELNQMIYVSSHFLGFKYTKLQKTNIFALVIENQVSLTELKHVKQLSIENYDHKNHNSLSYDNDTDNYFNIGIYNRVKTFLSYCKDKITSINVSKQNLYYFDIALSSLQTLTINDNISVSDLSNLIKNLKISKLNPKSFTLKITLRNLEYDQFVDMIKKLNLKTMCFLSFVGPFNEKYLTDFSHPNIILISSET